MGCDTSKSTDHGQDPACKPKSKSVFLSYHSNSTIIVTNFANQFSSRKWIILNKPDNNKSNKQKQNDKLDSKNINSELVICFITRKYLQLCNKELSDLARLERPIFLVFLEKILKIEGIDENTQKYLKFSGHYNLFDLSNRVVNAENVKTIQFEEFFKIMDFYTGQVKPITEQTKFEYNYLFSYSFRDRDLINDIASLVKQRGYNVYLDENHTEEEEIKFEKLQTTVNDGFFNSEIICFFLTNSYLQTINVQQEISWAAKLKKKCLIILLEENIDISLGIQIYLKDIQILNAFEKSYEDLHRSYYIFKSIINHTQEIDESVEDEIPGKPVQIITRDEKGFLKINEDILSRIENLEALATIVVVGPYRTGKSYIMNRFLKRQEGFELGGEVDACTEGIWMWDNFSEKKMIDGKEVTLLYLDTEGLDSPKVASGWDVKLFTLALLMASFFMYNSKNAIGKADLNMISAVTQISEKIKIETKSKDYGNDYGNEGTDFIWVLRDFFLGSKYDEKEFIGNKYLEHILQANDSSSDIEINIKKALKKAFRNMYCHTIKAPTNDVKMLRNLDKIDWEDLDLLFRNSIDKLCAMVKKNADAKRINGLLVNGSVYADFLRAAVKSINENKQIDVAVSLAASIQHVLEKNLAEAVNNYKNGMDEFISEYPLPQNWYALKEKHDKVYESCIEFLAKNNFGSEKQVHEYMINFQVKIKGKTAEDRTCIWQGYVTQNAKAIQKHNKGIIYLLYNEHVKSKQYTFKSDREYEDALNKVIREYETTGFEGEEMIKVKEEFLKAIEIDKSEFKNQLQKIIRQQQEIIEKEKLYELEKKKREEQQEKIKDFENRMLAVKNFLDLYKKQIKEKEQNFAQMQEKIKNWSKDEVFIEKERKALLDLAKLKEDEINKKKREAKEMENHLKNMQKELNADKIKAKEAEETLLQLDLALQNIKN